MRIVHTIRIVLIVGAGGILIGTGVYGLCTHVVKTGAEMTAAGIALLWASSPIWMPRKLSHAMVDLGGRAIEQSAIERMQAENRAKYGRPGDKKTASDRIVLRDGKYVELWPSLGTEPEDELPMRPGYLSWNDVQRAAFDNGVSMWKICRKCGNPQEAVCRLGVCERCDAEGSRKRRVARRRQRMIDKSVYGRMGL